MSQLSYKEFYDQALEDNIEFLNMSDPIAMDEFEKVIKEKYVQYSERAEPTTIAPVKAEYFSDLQEKFMKGFNRECLMAEAPARIYFFQILSIIFKKTVDETNWAKRNYDIITSNSNVRSINPVLHFFWQQETSTGKSKGHKFFIKVSKAISRNIARTSKLKSANRYTIRRTKWTETQETFINHFAQKQTAKGMQYDFTAPPVKGIFEESDLIASEECSFLFNEKQQNKQNISELLLDSLEGNSISKTLVSWNGNETTTRPNFVFSGLSRPTKNITTDFFEKGLFQRMLMYTRSTTQGMRFYALDKGQDMNKCPTSYINMLAQEFEDLYRWKVKSNLQNLTYFDNDKMKSLIKKAIIQEFGKLNLDYKSQLGIRKGVEPFLSRYYSNNLHILMILCAFSRKSTVIEEQDFIESNRIIKECINSIKLFGEENLPPDTKLEKKEKIMMRFTIYFAVMKKNNLIPFARNELEIYLNNKTKKSLRVITTYVSEFISIGFLIEDEKTNLLTVNKKDYANFMGTINDQVKAKRGKRK